jgi:hypothetical protein
MPVQGFVPLNYGYCLKLYSPKLSYSLHWQRETSAFQRVSPASAGGEINSAVTHVCDEINAQLPCRGSSGSCLQEAAHFCAARLRAFLSYPHSLLNGSELHLYNHPVILLTHVRGMSGTHKTLPKGNVIYKAFTNYLHRGNNNEQKRPSEIRIGSGKCGTGGEGIR